MENAVKNFVFTGVSVFAYAVDKVRETVETLMNEDKISSEEGQKIIEDFVRNTESKKEEFEAQLKMLSEKLTEQVKGSFSTISVGSGSSDIEDLEARIEALEAKAPAKKTTVKKTAAAVKA